MMREVERRLSTEPTPVVQIARQMYGEPTRAQREGVRRAVRALVARGVLVRSTPYEAWQAWQSLTRAERSALYTCRSWVRRATER